MPKIKCPITECEYETADLDAAIVASLLTVHSNVHSSNNVPAAKTEKDKRPSISAAGSSDEWSYFISRWSEYVSATKIAGRDKVDQLLECCDESLRKDLTRSTGGSLTDKTEETVLAAIKYLLYVMKTLWLLGSHSIICAKTGMNKCVISLQNIVDKQESVNLLSHALTAIMRSITLTP